MLEFVGGDEDLVVFLDSLSSSLGPMPGYFAGEFLQLFVRLRFSL